MTLHKYGNQNTHIGEYNPLQNHYI